MKLSDFDFALPSELIAQHPLPCRSNSCLMVLNSAENTISHRYFFDLPSLLRPFDLLVFNESKVIPARFFARKMTGGRVELLFERAISHQKAWVHIKSNRPVQIGMDLVLDNEQIIQITGRRENLFEVSLELGGWNALLKEVGSIPLPPYITRNPDAEDFERYQTIYAQYEGSVAAPTAGLHFDASLMKQLSLKGVECAFVTLHVGAGTFQPVRAENIEDHRIHQEWVEVGEDVCEKIKQTRMRGGRVIAVGTTSVRSLETAAASGEVLPYSGLTQLFIYPGYQFRSIDGLITNFHLPKSSLLMLVAAFAGYETMMNAYQVAIKEKYRFFSYGDGMLIF